METKQFSRLKENETKQFYKVLFLNKSDNRERFIHHQCERINDEVVHHYFEYKLGLNIDTVPFNPSGSCKSGGLYFTTAEYLHNYFHVGDYIAIIDLPQNARIYRDPGGNFFKADQIFIKKIIPIHEFFLFENEKYVEKLLKRDGLMLKYVKNQTDKFVKIALLQNGNALKFVKNKTFEFCKLAVSQDGNAIIYLPRKYQESKEIGDCF